MADIGCQDLRTRTASVFSIRAFFDTLLDLDFRLNPDPQLLGVYLALYNSLVDDDEDVRDQGASVVSAILSVAIFPAADKGTTTMSLSPPAARKGLLQLLCEGYRSSMMLCIESVRHLTGMDSALDCDTAQKPENNPQTGEGKSVLHLRPVVDLSLEARITSTVVFVEERQNLYIDTVIEAEDWAELLCRLDPNAWPSSLASDLEIWTIGGLTHILEVIQDSIDGALSPTSKPEVFTLFTRVLLAAKVFIKRGILHVTSEGNGKEHVFIGLLQELLDLGRSKLFHDLLIHRIEVILWEIGLPASGSEVVAAVKS